MQKQGCSIPEFVLYCATSKEPECGCTLDELQAQLDREGLKHLSLVDASCYKYAFQTSDRKEQKGKLVFVFEDATNLEAVNQESRSKLMKVLEKLSVDLDKYEVRIAAKDALRVANEDRAVES